MQLCVSDDFFLLLQSTYSGRNVRSRIVKQWNQLGGVLLMSDATFAKLAQEKEMYPSLQKPDVLVVDEAHTIKNSGTKIFQALSEISTPRKIGAISK